MRFRLPIVDDERAQNILHAFADLRLCPVTDEHVHRFPFPDLVLKGVDKLLITFETMDTDVSGFPSDIDLGTRIPSPCGSV